MCKYLDREKITDHKDVVNFTWMAQQELYNEVKQPQFSTSKNNKALEQTSKLLNFKILFFWLRGVIYFMHLNFENKICIYKCLIFIKVIRIMIWDKDWSTPVAYILPLSRDVTLINWLWTSTLISSSVKWR